MSQDFGNLQAPPMLLTPAMQSAVTFLQRVLPSGNYFYATSHVQPGVIKSWRDDPQQNFVNMVSRNFYLSDAGMNTYFGLSAFRQARHNIPGKNYPVFRTQQNACNQKCLWLDIDCGKGDSPYNNEEDAIRALLDFITKTGLPTPLVVYSGKGVHIYWTFAEVIPTDQWVQLAAMLKNLTLHYGLVADHSRTTDPASVLRLPGTINYGKDGVARPVRWMIQSVDYSVLDIAKILIKAVRSSGAQPALVNPVSSLQVPVVDLPRPPIDVLQNFQTAMDNLQGVKRLPHRIITDCKQVRTAGTGTYSQWYNMMLVMKHCEYGDIAVHEISKMDPARYNPSDTNLKYQQAVDGGYGPALCTTFDDKDPGICKDCPYWGKIKTPLLLGEPYVETQVLHEPGPNIDLVNGTAVVEATTPTMEIVTFTSKEFSVVPGQGIVWHKRELVTGEAVDPDEDAGHYVVKDYLINDSEIYIHCICIDNTDGNMQRSYVMRRKTQGRSPEDIVFSVETDLSGASCIKWLANHGMLPRKPKFNKAMSDFMSTYLASVQNRLPEIVVRETFGWSESHNKFTGETTEGFVVGHTMYTPQGPVAVKLNARCERLSSAFSQAGNFDTWRHIPLMYKTLDQPMPSLLMCAALGSPTMKFGIGTATNAIFNLWETKGGKGKSTVLRNLNTIWGHPKGLMLSKNDTNSGRYQVMSVRQNICVCMDEITQMSGEELSDFIYDAANGREKIKSLASGTQIAKTGSWETVTFMTSNRSIYEMMRQYHQQSDATSMRVIELQCNFADYAGTTYGEYISAVSKLQDQHYGWAGPMYVEYLMAHPGMIREIAEEAAAWDTANRKYSDERFWTGALGFAIANGRRAVAAGILPYDMDYLEEYARKTILPELRTKIRSNFITYNHNTITDFLNEMLGSTLIVKSENRNANEKDPGVMYGVDPYVVQFPKNDLAIRFEQKEQHIYISTRALSKWHQKYGLSLDTTLQELISSGRWQASDKLQYNLGKGVSAISRGRTTAIVIDARSLDTVPMEYRGY